ncbi:GIDE domain-containing protein [Natronolimnohabitans innermongolicus]|uniref:RING-type E3 ubiquitin transferase n=1 Tax=Natronolimnohabitans innermongolicus JCM 12255 TaxID=1227499 RepID=L9XHQ5_9EURY|nr:GIDE domain-containing protein [Natronolimnohabitans innermongolicus]ELY61132.1 hypothetical protein C493_03400 [Natronolimnohabitans innermongolicus JCM 12255]
MTVETLLWLGFAVVAAIFLLIGGRDLRSVTHMLRSDTIDVGSLHGYDGPVEIAGIARPDGDHGTVTAPFSGTACLVYTYVVEQEYTTSDDTSWKTLAQGREAVMFLVSDDTGAVRVDPVGATLSFEEHVMTVAPGEELPAELDQYIEETDAVEKQDRTMDLRITDLHVGHRQRFTERRLDVDETVYVYGQARRGPSAGWESDAVDAVVGADDAVPTFVISDTNERTTAWRFARTGLLRVGIGGVIAVILLVYAI